MITTDAIYNTLIASGSYEEGVTGTLKDGSGATVLNISNEYIKTGSLIIDNKCINNDDLEPGAVYAAELKITISGNAGLTNSQKSSLQNGSLNLTYTITDGNSSSSISIGIYYIIEVTLKDEDIEIIAEDMMSRLSKNIPTAVREDLNFVARTPYELLDLCCQNCSTSRRPISLANDETEFDSWNNADASFLIPVTADIATYRDLVAEVAKIMGCFATIDKNTNGLILKRLNPHSNSNVWTLNEDIRYRTEKSGYICRFGKVALGNESYPDTSDEDVSGLILSMRATELTDDSELLPGVVQNLYTEFSGISYRPCKIEFMGNIALEVGDWIGVNYTEDGTTYTFRTIITHLNWILNGKELIESTGSSAATTQKVGSKGSGESRNSSSIDNLESRIETLESSGGGNKIYTSTADPDETAGNEGDMWVKYETQEPIEILDWVTFKSFSFTTDDIKDLVAQTNRWAFTLSLIFTMQSSYSGQLLRVAPIGHPSPKNYGIAFNVIKIPQGQVSELGTGGYISPNDFNIDDYIGTKLTVSLNNVGGWPNLGATGTISKPLDAPPYSEEIISTHWDEYSYYPANPKLKFTLDGGNGNVKFHTLGIHYSGGDVYTPCVQIVPYRQGFTYGLAVLWVGGGETPAPIVNLIPMDDSIIGSSDDVIITYTAPNKIKNEHVKIENEWTERGDSDTSVEYTPAAEWYTNSFGALIVNGKTVDISGPEIPDPDIIPEYLEGTLIATYFPYGYRPSEPFNPSTRIYAPPSSKIISHTTAEWESLGVSTVSESGVLYVYTDYKQDESGNNIPGFKMGDGNAYVADLPFSSAMFDMHMNNTDIHITAAEREKWNNKVSVLMNESTNNLFFITG